jgi:alpha-galactosidase
MAGIDYNLEAHNIKSQTGTIEEVAAGLILKNANPTIELTTSIKNYYRHGWQSWGLTNWQSPDFKLPVQKPEILHPMQTDPVYINCELPNGSSLAAVEFEDGKILLIGALDLDAHCQLNQTFLEAKYENTPGDWFIGYGTEQTVFRDYAKLLGDRFGMHRNKPSHNVWCSWYSFYVAITEPLLYKVFEEFADAPLDVLQVDDGWQVAVGDWDANQKFPSGMKALADKIKSTGRQAGLWLAPLIAVKSSKLFNEHPSWFLKDTSGKFVSAGYNWGEQLYALDTTIPEVLEFLDGLMKKVTGWGFDYIKLDFLYAGALPGVRQEEMGREVAYRKGLKVIRESLGEAYFLTCGAPVIPSLGLCDAMRIGPDVAAEWENYRDANLFYNATTPSAKNAIRTTINRIWLKPLVACDPDVVYFRTKNSTLTEEEKILLQDLALVCQFKATSDVPKWLQPEESKKMIEFLNFNPAKIERIGRNEFKIEDRLVDFSSAMSMPDIPTGLTSVKRAIVGGAANQSFVLTIFDRLFKAGLEKQMKDI